MSNATKNVVMSSYFACSVCFMFFVFPVETLTPYQKRLAAAKVARFQQQIAKEELKLLPAHERSSIGQGVYQWWNTTRDDDTTKWALFDQTAGNTATVRMYKQFWLPQSSFFSSATFEWQLEEQGCWVLCKNARKIYTLSFSHPNIWHWSRPYASDETVGDPKTCPFEEVRAESAPSCLSSCCSSLREKIFRSIAAEHNKQS